MRLKKFSSKVFLLALGLFLWGIGCSPSLFDDVVTTDNPVTKKAPVFEDINQSEGSSTTAGNPGHGPSPTRDFHLNNLVYFPDDNDIVPVVGSAYGPFFPEGGQIVISEFALETSTEVLNVTSDISAESDLCTEEGVVCCPVDEDFKYECYLPLVDRSLSEVFVGVMDAGFNVLSSRREPVQPNLLWLGQVPKDIQVAGTSLNNDGENQAGIGVLGDKRLLQVKEIGGQFKVLGEHAVEYEQVGGLSEDVPQIAFDDSGSLALRDESGGVRLYSSSFVPLTGVERFEFVDSGVVTTLAEADEYTILTKTFSNKNWFGVKNRPSTSSKAFVYADDHNVVFNPRSIKIYDDTINSANTFNRTLSLDVANVGGVDVAISVYKADGENIFMTMAYKNSSGNSKIVEFDPGIYNENIDDYQLAILKNQEGSSNSVSERGDIVVLDKTKKVVFFEEFFSDTHSLAGSDFFSPLRNKSIFAGESPLQMALDEERGELSILNEDNKILRYKVKDGTRVRGMQRIQNSKKIIDINNYITKSGVIIRSNHIKYHQGDSGKYLIVGVENLKGMITIKID